MSLRLRLLISLISITCFTVLAIAISSLYVLDSVSTKAISDKTQKDLQAKLVNTTDALNNYFSNVAAQIENKADNEYWQKAAVSFVSDFKQYSNERGSLSGSEMDALTAYYKDDFGELYYARNDKRVANIDSLLSPLSENSKALQYDFIAGSRFDIGGKDALVRLPNTTSYAETHAGFHPLARRFLQKFGYYDIFMVDPNSGDLVYSVFKELDYATNLKSGPYANTGIGEAFRKANESAHNGEVYYSTLAPYLPSYDAVAGFLSIPIYDGENKVAILIFQIPMDRVNSVFTRNEHWEQQGFGLTGETYLVNEEYTLVTENRLFIENQAQYLAEMEAISPELAHKIESAGTSAGIKTIKTFATEQALQGNNGVTILPDFKGAEVFSAYANFKLGNHDYAFVAEMEKTEALALVPLMHRKILWSIVWVALAVLIVAVAFAFYFTRRVSTPLDDVGQVCASLTSGDGDLTMRLKECGISEIDVLLRSFNLFIEQIQDIIVNVSGDAEALASASQELSSVTLETKKNAVEQRNQTDNVSSSMNDLAESIKEVSSTVSDSEAHSDEVNAELAERLDKTSDASQNIKELVDLIKSSSVTISGLRNEVVKVTDLLEDINSLADQTNLLALNAAIEAARAGDAGRGFSVVADEVRTLATRSQESTSKIRTIVDVMTAASNDSVDVMENAVVSAEQGIVVVDTLTDALSRLAQEISDNQKLTSTISSATNSQTAASINVRDSVESINTMALEAQSGAVQSSESAGELAKIAARTMEMVSRFKIR